MGQMTSSLNLEAFGIQLPGRDQIADEGGRKPRAVTCQRPLARHNTKYRVLISNTEVQIFGWPSKGGVIIHDHIDAIDLEFLGLDPLDLPETPFPDQNDEDTFCQRLLLLGATWWDSTARRQLLWVARDMDIGLVRELANFTEKGEMERRARWWDSAIRRQILDMIEPPDRELLQEIDAFAVNGELVPTERERCFVSVGWPTTEGLWVAELDSTLWALDGGDLIYPTDRARLTLARTMDERCQILRDHFDATFYEDVKDYKGLAFLNSWQDR